MTTTDAEVLGTFYGDEEFPIQWQEGERELFWIYDDLHIPNPVSPMFFDLGGWWLTCDHMFRRFGTPFACDWIAKNINGYVYTAAIPADPSIHAEATEYQSRYVPRVPRDPSYPQKIGAYMTLLTNERNTRIRKDTLFGQPYCMYCPFVGCFSTGKTGKTSAHMGQFG